MRDAISFVFSSPRHHAEILLPVVRGLQANGHACRVISMAEFRGLSTPNHWDAGGAPVRRLMPLRRPGRIPPLRGDQPWLDTRSATQAAVWTLGLGPRLRWLLRGSKIVVIPNDSVFPYVQLARLLRRHDVPFVLVQEGIRFRVPGLGETAYGKHGASRVCAWGDGSAEHFESIGVPRSSLRVTGNPRFDDVDPRRWHPEGAKLLATLGVASPPLLFVSNPIETQGFGTLAFKLRMFETFLREAHPVLVRFGVPLVVKLHPHENPTDFVAVAARANVPITLAGDAALFPLLATARAAIVIASTVGLEALVFGLPLGVLQIPDHGYAFEYVARGAAIGIAAGAIGEAVEKLVGDDHQARRSAARGFVDRHLANRGAASESVGAAILSAAGAP